MNTGSNTETLKKLCLTNETEILFDINVSKCYNKCITEREVKMSETIIIPKVSKMVSTTFPPAVYQGYIFIKENGIHLWNQYSGIIRLTHEDAMTDANKMAEEIKIGL